MTNKNRMCADCRNALAHNGAYCRPCKNVRQRARYEAMRAQRPKVVKRGANQWTNRDACNCGTPKCNGLTCERATA